MEKVVGVRFRNVGKIYYFNPKNYKVKVGDHVIVETARGVEYGRVVLEPRSVKEDEVVHPLKEVLRVATKEDEDHEAENRQKEKEAFKICKKKIREHELDMKLEDALPYMTSHVAEALGLQGKKGTIQKGADADLLLWDNDLKLDSYIAGGKIFMQKEKIICKGTYEK